MALFRFGEFEADEERFELRHRSVKLPVQRLALDVLFHLIRQRSRVVTKEELVLGPWAGANVSSGSVSRAVMLIRRATRAAGDVIDTVRGRGYRFVGMLREEQEEVPRPQRTADGAEPMLFVLQAITDRAAASVMLRDLLREGSSSVPLLLVARPAQPKAEARLPLQEDGQVERSSS